MSDLTMTASKVLDESQMREAICTAIAVSPSLRQLAKTWGVSPSHLSDCANGKRAPGPLILRHFGMERRVVVSYHASETAGSARLGTREGSET